MFSAGRAVLTGLIDRSIEERTKVYFAQNEESLLRAYVESGEGIDRAGGFAIQVSPLVPFPSALLTPRRAHDPQGLGGMLVSKVDGDYHNVVGFPAASFFKFLNVLIEEEVDFLDD